MPSGKLRQALRGHGHRLAAFVQVGKAGVTPGLLKQLGQTLADHELVKLKVGADSPADRFAVAEQLATLPGVNIVQIVGGVILLYKRDPDVTRYEGQSAHAKAMESAVTKDAPARTRSKDRVKREDRPKRMGSDKAKAPRRSPLLTKLERRSSSSPGKKTHRR